MTKTYLVKRGLYWRFIRWIGHKTKNLSIIKSGCYLKEVEVPLLEKSLDIYLYVFEEVARASALALDRLIVNGDKSH
jgi:hypothetical protein